MSHIFDALQRSEAERSGVERSRTDAPDLSEATEMLRRAERRAASKWEAGALSEFHDGTNGADHSTSLGVLDVPAISTLPEAPARTASPQIEHSPTDQHRDVFGQFPSLKISLSPQSRLVCLTDGGSPAAEAFRLLGVRLRHLRRDRPLKKVLITSTIPQEGKSMVSGNLACTLAQRTQQKTLVLEGDLRRPSLSKMFGLGKNPGLCEWLRGGHSLTASIYRLEEANLWILPAGSSPSNALELLQSGRLSTLMDQLSAWFDWIVIDSPPVLPLADTSVWMRLADGILLTTRQGTTQKRQLQRGLEAIESKKLIGALVNSSKNATASDYYYGPGSNGQ
jgi:capsular exopolysaccharide synthesis family protein